MRWIQRSALGALAASAVIAVTAATAWADGGTPVTCGSVITSPGEYFLASDCAGPGITIAASGVDLRLDGHTMSATAACFGSGVVASSVSRLRIEGPGTITGYLDGIGFVSVDDSHVAVVTATHNCNIGVFSLGTSDEFNRNVASFTGTAILLGRGLRSVARTTCS